MDVGRGSTGAASSVSLTASVVGERVRITPCHTPGRIRHTPPELSVPDEGPSTEPDPDPARSQIRTQLRAAAAHPDGRAARTRTVGRVAPGRSVAGHRPGRLPGTVPVGRHAPVPVVPRAPPRSSTAHPPPGVSGPVVYSAPPPLNSSGVPAVLVGRETRPPGGTVRAPTLRRTHGAPNVDASMAPADPRSRLVP